MTVINVFLKKRIDQLLREYENPEQVIDLLSKTIPLEGDNKEEAFENIVDYVRKVWDEQEQYNLESDYFSDFPEEESENWMDASNYESQDFLNGYKSEISNETPVGKEYIEDEFHEIILEEEIGTLEKISQIKIKFSSFEEDLKNLPLLKDVQIMLEFLFSNEVPELIRKKDGEIRKTSYKKLWRKLAKKLSTSSQGEESIKYAEFIYNLGEDAGLFEESDSSSKLVNTKFTKKIIEGKMKLSNLYMRLFKSFWLYNRDFYLDKEDISFIEYDDLEFKIAPLLLSTALSPVYAEEVYIPAFIESLIEEQSFQSLSKEESKRMLLYGIYETHRLCFLPFYHLGILGVTADNKERGKICLTSFGAVALRTILEVYSPLLQAETFLSVANNILTSILMVKALFSSGTDETENSKLYEQMQSLATEVDIAINSFFLYVSEPSVDKGNITQVNQVSRYILEKVLATGEQYKIAIGYENILQEIFESGKNLS